MTMDAQTKIARNTSILMGMQMGVKVLGVIVSVLLARYLAPQGFGILAFALAFASLFSLLPGFGMGSLTIRDLARDPQHLNQYLCNGLIAKALLSIGALTLISVVLWVMGYSADRVPIVLLAGAVMALETTLRFSLSPFRAAQRMASVALMNLAYHGGWMLAALSIVWLKGGLIELLCARILVLLVVLFVSVWLIHKRLGGLVWTFDPPFIRRMLKTAFPFAISTLFVTIYTSIDVVMLSFMQGDVMTGWYAVARRFFRVFTFIPTSVRGAVLPAMSKSSRTQPGELQESLVRSCKALWMIALPIAGGIFMLADRLVLWLYGPEYVAAILAVRILIWSVLFTFVNGILWAALVSLDRERQVGVCLGFGALFNVLTNMVVIPRFGYVGAAATTVLSFATVFLLQVRLLKRVLPTFSVFGQIIKPIGATASMMAFAWLSRAGVLVYTVLGSAAVYIGCLIASRAVGRREWTFITGLIQGKTLGEEAGSSV